MLIQIGENSASVTPYGSLGDGYYTVGSVGRSQSDTARYRAEVSLVMRALTAAVIGTLMALVFACSAARAEISGCAAIPIENSIFCSGS